MNQSCYNQNYSSDQISEILYMIKDCIYNDKFLLSTNSNRQENRNFTSEFSLSHLKIKEILLGIAADDFCHSLKNEHTGFEHEILFVFCPKVILFNIHGVEEKVNIYTKFNIIEQTDGKRVIVISFHRCNRPISYLFKT